jgi:calcineurin-like phosphoesterase family protein
MSGIAEIPKDDILIHLGDICIGDDEAVHARMMDAMPRTRILVRGNHDNKSIQWYYDHGWTFVCDSFELLFCGRYLYFSHRPQPMMGHFTRNIHGHTHGNMHRSEEFIHWYDVDYHFDISPELMGYQPLRLDSWILKGMKSRLDVPPATNPE